MGWKLGLNVLYTIGIFMCAVIAYEGYQSSHYEYFLGAVFIAGLFVILKIKLLKQLRPPVK